MGRSGKGSRGGRSSEAGMVIFLFLQILAAHFDDIHAGRLKHAFSSVNVLAIATALPYRNNHRLL